MVRLRGYDEIAQAMDYAGVFITLTAPGRFHPYHKRGVFNTKYKGATPREAQDYLNQVWQRARAAWGNDGLRVFGFRIAEPHHDGTPHWHILLYMPKDTVSRVLQPLIIHAIKDDIAELQGEISRRIDIKHVDFARYGSAVGYLAKYVAKNIDGKKTTGESIGDDLEAQQFISESVERVTAWASVWGIRQFQQIGAVSVTVWRELRRGIQHDFFEGQAADFELMAEIAEAADAGDWALFVELMGGALVARDDQPIRPLRVLSEKANDYGELFDIIKGVIMRGTSRMITRYHTWTITRAGQVPEQEAGPGQCDPPGEHLRAA